MSFLHLENPTNDCCYIKRHPSGHFVRNLGDVGDRKIETDVLLLEHDVPFLPFSKQVLSYLPPEGENWLVTDVDLPGRVDLRHLDVCSIDPPGKLSPFAIGRIV
jgi:exosome complex exonuclease DIS3/RRP44